MAKVKVAVPYTKVWYLNETDDTVETLELDGKVLTKEIKEQLKDGQKFIQKKFLRDEFYVESYELLLLKGAIL